MSNTNSIGIKVNLGCGPGPQPAGWVHLDGSWNSRLARFNFVRRALATLGLIPADNASLAWASDVVTADLRHRLPFRSQVAQCVYASHVFEHLYEDEGRQLLAECHRVLKPGGVIRLVVPDLRPAVERYIASASQPRNRSTPLPADQLNEDLLLRPPSRPRAHFAYRIYVALTEFHSHKWLYDTESLSQRLIHAGFVDVERRLFLESRIDGIDEIETAERADDPTVLCIEAVKSPITP